MKREKTQQQTRRAARGTVPGFLGMAEIAKLAGGERCKTCHVLLRADLQCFRSDCGQGGRR